MTNGELDRWLQDQAVLTKLKLQYFIGPNAIPYAKILCGYIRETLKENSEVCEACGERHITNENKSGPQE